MWPSRRGKHLAPAFIALFERAYDRIIRAKLAFHGAQPPLIRPAGKDSRGRTPRRIGHNLLRRLDERRCDVLRFLSNACVPCTNNLAQRNARMMKLRQKISGGFRSAQGTEDFATIRSLISTMKKQDWNTMRSIIYQSQQHHAHYATSNQLSMGDLGSYIYFRFCRDSPKIHRCASQ